MIHSSSIRIFFFSSRRRHTRLQGDWSSDVCSSDLPFLGDDALGQAAMDGAAAHCGASSTVAMASATYCTLAPDRPDMHMRPERIRYTPCSSRRRWTWGSLMPV